ncbi:MAG: exo-alpha-sialidase, partial [Candidatus Eremiobacteraeota bacterium]|nr:exo-alpha-sialidase [Candidatus Eremiobacteraeota bacterium]
SASRDGGRTFSAPATIGTRVVFGLQQLRAHVRAGNYAFDEDSVPQLGAGAAPAGRGLRVYAVWSDLRTGSSRLLFARSDDRGRQWTAPRVILAGSGSPGESQYQPSLAVNATGAIGVSWYGAAPSRNTMAEMFAISRDGGDTFSTPVRISTGPAPLYPAGGDGYFAQAFPDTMGMWVGLTSPLIRWPSRGDYMGLDADRDGAFHPIWIDARNGVNQVWSATVGPGAPAAAPDHLTSRDVTALTGMEFGVGAWDQRSHTLSVPARLRNASDKVLYPPYTITVTRTQNPYFPTVAPNVTILNADNGKTGAGAAFVYSAAMLGNLGRLEPGADTASRTWKIRIPGASFDPAFVTKITGLVAAP